MIISKCLFNQFTFLLVYFIQFTLFCSFQKGNHKIFFTLIWKYRYESFHAEGMFIRYICVFYFWIFIFFLKKLWYTLLCANKIRESCYFTAANIGKNISEIRYARAIQTWIFRFHLDTQLYSWFHRVWWNSHHLFIFVLIHDEWNKNISISMAFFVFPFFVHLLFINFYFFKCTIWIMNYCPLFKGNVLFITISMELSE